MKSDASLARSFTVEYTCSTTVKVVREIRWWAGQQRLCGGRSSTFPVGRAQLRSARDINEGKVMLPALPGGTLLAMSDHES